MAMLEIKINHSENSYLLGSLDLENKTGHVGVVFIEPKKQKQGIAGQLLLKFIEECKFHNIERITGYSTNPNAIKAAAKVIGKERFEIKDLETDKEINFDEAIKTGKNYSVSINL